MSWAVATAHQVSRSPVTKLNRRVFPVFRILRTPSFLMTLLASLRFGTGDETVTFDRRDERGPHGSSFLLRARDSGRQWMRGYRPRCGLDRVFEFRSWGLRPRLYADARYRGLRAGYEHYTDLLGECGMTGKFVWPVILFLILMWAPITRGKNNDDVVVLKNGDRLTGEIKGLQRGELSIKADYMAEAVRLDW